MRKSITPKSREHIARIANVCKPEGISGSDRPTSADYGPMPGVDPQETVVIVSFAATGPDATG